MNSSLTTSDPAARDAHATRHTPHATRHTPCPHQPALSGSVAQTQPPDSLHLCLQAHGLRSSHAARLDAPRRYDTPSSSPHPRTATHTHHRTHTTAHAPPHTDARSAVRKCVHDGRLTSGPATYADSDAITQLSEPTAPAHTPHLVWPNPNPNPPHTAPAPARTQLTAHSARSPAPPRPAPSVASGNRPRHPCGRRCYLARRCGASRIILSCRHTHGAFSLESGRT